MLSQANRRTERRSTETLKRKGMEKYTGEWSTDDNEPHGRGKLVHMDGTIYEGYWLNG